MHTFVTATVFARSASTFEKWEPAVAGAAADCRRPTQRAWPTDNATSGSSTDCARSGGQSCRRFERARSEAVAAPCRVSAERNQPEKSGTGSSRRCCGLWAADRESTAARIRRSVVIYRCSRSRGRPSERGQPTTLRLVRRVARTTLGCPRERQSHSATGGPSHAKAVSAQSGVSTPCIPQGHGQPRTISCITK